MGYFNHGIATLKQSIKGLGREIKEGSEGIITAYLPEDEKFSVKLGNKEWIKF